MLHLALTTKVCSQIVDLLRKRRWSITRIARTIGASRDYVRRIQEQRQSFQLGEVQALAKACRTQPHRLIFDSFDPAKLDVDLRGLYDLTRQAVVSHEEFAQVLRRKPSRKRRPAGKAA